MSCSLQPEIDNVLGFFKSIKFTQPLSITLLATTIDALNSDVRGDDLISMIVEKVPAEAFVLQEVMATSRFYERFRTFLNLMSIETQSVRSTRDMLVMRILISIYGDDVADEMFTVFKENRKMMRLNPLTDIKLYGNEEPSRPPPYPNLSPISPDAISTLSAEQMRSIQHSSFHLATRILTPCQCLTLFLSLTRLTMRTTILYRK